nr:hypothetical protein [Tanacetum cinerariifolium]
MGCLARSGRYCTLHKPWPKVRSAKKKTLLDILNDKCDLPMGCDDWILKSFGKKKLVKSWNKEHSKRESEKNKANRRKMMVQVTGKKSYALVREEVKIKWKN